MIKDKYKPSKYYPLWYIQTSWDSTDFNTEKMTSTCSSNTVPMEI